MSDLVGKSLGRYHILEPLGEGGMAIVYKAYDMRLESEVAVKVIRIERLAPEILQRAMKRFEREAKALAQLTHPNLVKVLDYGEFENQPYLVMPYLPGGTLKQKMNGRPMPWQEAARLLIPIARALDYAHKRGMIHRDVKPSNILITESGEPMLTDFGVAKIIDEEATLDLTGTSAAVGTPEYMAPEQVTSKTVDQRADIYALGIVFYEMVTGRRPFQADTPMAVLFKHASEPLPRPKSFVPSLPDAVERILLKALAKQPADRYASMGEVAAALEALLMNVSAPAREMESPPAQPLRTRPPQSSPERTTEKTMRDTNTAAFVPEKSSIPSNLRRAWPMALVFLCLGAILVSTLVILNQPGPSTPTAYPVTEAPITVAPTEPPVAMTEAPTEPPALPDEITDSKGVVMRLIPAGEFTMGSNGGGNDEKPVHQVYLDAYYMDKYEVTNALYGACVNVGVCDPPRDDSSSTRSSYYGNAQYNEYPVINVDWDMASTYCEWRGARLPTEAEWEKAARGTDERIYPWGNVFQCRNGNFDDETQFDSSVVPGGPNCDGYVDTSPVGSYASGQSPYGIYDLAGNVWEWVADWFSWTYYQTSPSENPLGPGSGQERVLRGGSWFNYIDFSVRASNRYRNDPTLTYSYLGFRCSRSP